MVIYTRKGDKGKTALFGSAAKKNFVSKNSLIIRAVGALDELNSYLGIINLRADKKLKSKLLKIQRTLFSVGAILAKTKLPFSSAIVKSFEKEINAVQKKLPPMKHFVLPGGGEMGSNLHYARTLARRAEREVVALAETEKVNPKISIFLNRLSDYLYIKAEEANWLEGKKEEIWQGKR